MSEMRYDPVLNTWIILAENRVRRPKQFTESHASAEIEPCPFCEGNEHLTPKEKDAMPNVSSYQHNNPGWRLRSVPNRYPSVLPDSEPTRQRFGPYQCKNGTGTQEVIIDTPRHVSKMGLLHLSEIRDLVHFSCSRLATLRREYRWHYAQWFKNQGHLAGASLEHLHSQIIAVPHIPDAILHQGTALKHLRQQFQECYYCHLLKYEHQVQQRIVAENAYMIALCPYASRFCAEVKIFPKRHTSCLTDATPGELDALASLIHRVSQRLDVILPVAAYNIILRNTPWTDTYEPDPIFHWHLDFLPRVTGIAGLEWGTGEYINPVAPEAAAALLRSTRKEKIRI